MSRDRERVRSGVSRPSLGPAMERDRRMRSPRLLLLPSDGWGSRPFQCTSSLGRHNGSVLRLHFHRVSRHEDETKEEALGRHETWAVRGRPEVREWRDAVSGTAPEEAEGSPSIEGEHRCPPRCEIPPRACWIFRPSRWDLYRRRTRPMTQQAPRSTPTVARVCSGGTTVSSRPTASSKNRAHPPLVEPPKTGRMREDFATLPSTVP